jgi:hypothetical protein
MTSRTVLAVAGLPSRSSPERRAEAGDPTVRQLEPIESLVAPTGWPSPARVDARGPLVGCARWAGSLSALRVLENFPLYVVRGPEGFPLHSRAATRRDDDTGDCGRAFLIDSASILIRETRMQITCSCASRRPTRSTPCSGIGPTMTRRARTSGPVTSSGTRRSSCGDPIGRKGQGCRKPAVECRRIASCAAATRIRQA